MVVHKNTSVPRPKNALGMLTLEKLCKLRFLYHIYKIENKNFPHWYIHLQLVNETIEINARQEPICSSSPNNYK